MELYNEQQLRNALYILHYSEKEMSEDQVVNELTPIELPSDEEIEKHSRLYGIGFPLIKIGALWMRDKIQGGNK